MSSSAPARVRWKGWIWVLLVLAALPRLAQLGAPPIGHHGWRQADTAAVARNFHHNGYRLLHPEVDWETPGYVEMELPLYPWVVALGYGLVGERIELARALAVAAALLSLYLVFALVRRHLGREEALWASLLWAVLPSTVFFGRAVMPESWMVAASLGGIYWFSRWRDHERWGPLLAAALLVCLAGLLKLTSLHLGLPLLWLAADRLRSSPRARVQLAVFAAIVLVPIIAWHLHAYRLGTATGATFGIFSGTAAKTGSWDLLLKTDFYHQVFAEFLAGRLLTWVAAPLLLLGLVLPRKTRGERLFDWWLAGGAIVLLLAAGGSYYHEYYGLPLVAPAVAHMGRALVWLRHRSRPAVVLVVAAIALVAGWRLMGYLALENDRGPRDFEVAQDLRVAAMLAKGTGPSDLVVACDRTDPTWFYLSRRRGWGRDCGAMDKRALTELRHQGAAYLVARHGDLAPGAGARLRRYLLEHHRVMADDGDAFLVDLTRLAPARLAQPPLWRDDFADGAPPADWALREGRWRESDGWLTIEPTRRHLSLRFAPEAPVGEIRGLRTTLKVEPGATTDRRRVLTLSGWRRGSSAVEAVLDLSSGRAVLALTEDGTARVATSGLLAVTPGETISIELRFDGFDFLLVLDSAPLLSLPAAPPDPGAPGFELTGRNLVLRLDELVILGPPTPAS